MSKETKDAFLTQWGWVWDGRIRPRLEGLTDGEYSWEPAPDCWTIPSDGEGNFGCDWPEGNPPPFTTIAWRLSHMGGPCLRGFTGLFTDTPVDWEAIVWPGTADDALAFLDDAVAEFRNGLAQFPANRLFDKLGAEAGPWSDDSFADMILHVFDEIVHHAAEVALLRDLYRARGGRP
jgi:DinB family protein